MAQGPTITAQSGQVSVSTSKAALVTRRTDKRSDAGARSSAWTAAGIAGLFIALQPGEAGDLFDFFGLPRFGRQRGKVPVLMNVALLDVFAASRMPPSAAQSAGAPIKRRRPRIIDPPAAQMRRNGDALGHGGDHLRRA